MTFSIKELAEYLNVSVSSIRKLVRERKIPFFRVGQRILFYEDDIMIFIRNQYNDLKIN